MIHFEKNETTFLTNLINLSCRIQVYILIDLLNCIVQEIACLMMQWALETLRIGYFAECYISA